MVAGTSSIMGTSHRQPPVRNLVASIQDGLTELFQLPDGWEIVVGNGGATFFWDAATFGVIQRQSQHLVFGEFSSKFAQAAANAPHLDEPMIVTSEPGTHPTAIGHDGIDLYALTHNETSTGVAMELHRPAGADPDALVAVDATSAAGGMTWNPDEVDIYYFSPQKCFGADGGVWLAACSPSAVERIEQIAASDRWRPASLDLGIALKNSRAHQTYNTPALATLIMLDAQVAWLNTHGGLDWAASRCAHSSSILYDWADARPWATPFVTNPDHRSSVVVTIDLDDQVHAGDITTALRANGIVDIDSYRKLGRNQLRVGTFPSVDPADVEALTTSIDAVVEMLAN
ncbi:MAG: phosphoserine transaminase [Ilumatobacter coccineus]|uniref:phosphoserine transaminase n=1 Tax=Ilumatobacter coccineus TaxID=467094 RepID=A0A2G6KA77_9ACTN|nr:MAG: phosphoserine transaminase [Ilumatobacter coccineus]